MKEAFLSAKLLILLASVPLAVWVGSLIARSGGSVGEFIEKNCRWLLVAFAVAHAGSGLFLRAGDSGFWYGIYVASLYLCAMLFVPMLRKLRVRSETSLRTRR